jgi:hypothetical protein
MNMGILKHLHDFFVPHADNNYAPHALRRRPLSLYAGLMVSVKLLSLFSLTLLPQNQALSASVTPANILELTNYSRKAYGLKDLKVNLALSLAAEEKVKDMIKNQYFAHVSPQNKTPWDFIKTQNYNYLIAGENLAVNFYDSEALQNAWMNSPGHKANILNKDFEDIGIGIAEAQYRGVNAIFVVQMFGTASEQSIQAKMAYNTPTEFISVPEVNVPTPSQISLAMPIIAGQAFSLTNNRDFSIHGYAPNADSIYVVVNNKPQIKLDVVNGEYKGDIKLSEGANKINVLSFSGESIASPLSKELNVKLDTTVPKVVATVQQVNSNGDKSYLVEVQASSDVTKMIATLGDQRVYLQPTANQIWQARISGDPGTLQGGLSVKAYNLAGNSGTSLVGTFTPNIQSSYGFLATKNVQVNYLGKSISLNSLNNLYAYFILFLLSCLVIAIAVKRNIQDLNLITHTSAMIVVAVILWIT